MPDVYSMVTVTTSTPCPLPNEVFYQYCLACNFLLHVLKSFQGIILSGGQRQRISVARALYQTTNVVFLVGLDTSVQTVKVDIN